MSFCHKYNHFDLLCYVILSYNDYITTLLLISFAQFGIRGFNLLCTFAN